MIITIYMLCQDETKKPTLVADKSITYTKTDCLNSPQKISQMMHDLFNADKLVEEHLWILGLSASMMPLALMPVGHGTMTEATADMKAIATRLLLCGAPAFACIIHNHPSGNPDISDTDMHLLKKIKKLLEELGSFLNIELLDFLILGENGTFYSASKETNLL